MEPIKDKKRAQDIIDHYSKKLGLEGKFELKIEPKRKECSYMDAPYMKIHKKFFEALDEKEFRPIVVHELGHPHQDLLTIRKLQGIFITLTIILFVFLPFSVFVGKFVTFIVLLIFLVAIFISRELDKENEIRIDKIVAENQDFYDIKDYINALLVCNDLNLSMHRTWIDKIESFLRPGVSTSHRIKRLKDYQ